MEQMYADTIIKVANKTENFTIISNEVPRDNTLSARAKGVYFYIMTLPKDWKIHKEEIYSHFTEGREALETAWNELKESGYIEKEVIRDKGKIAGTVWKVYESHRITGKPSDGKPVTRKPYDGKPVTGNQQLLSTDILNTDNTKELKQTKKPNVFLPVFETYISVYESIYGLKPIIVYDRITQQLKKLTKDVTVEQVVEAIKFSKNDEFSNKIKHELGALLSSGVIGRLINEARSFQNSSSSRINPAPLPDITCCGKKYDFNVGFCTVCGKKYNREGKVC